MERSYYFLKVFTAGIAFLAIGITLQAQIPYTTSPWVGDALPEESGTYYLYNVETGLWLQNNRKDRASWTTRAQVDVHGLDFIITKLPDGGYQIDPRFGHNHSLNGGDDFGYLDTGREVTPWEFIPSSYVPNSFEIVYGEESAIQVEEIPDDDGNIVDYYFSSFGQYTTWQLVSKEERMADLQKATKDDPKDATWLIGGWDFANQDERNGAWTNTIEGSGSGIAFREGYGGWICNRAAECWSRGTGDYYQVIQGLPNGTYGLTVQGFYRDGSTSSVLGKHEDGSEVIHAFYFANDVQAPFMSICDNGVTEDVENTFIQSNGFYGPGDGGDALPRATNAFLLGYYQNPEIKVVVTDGTLRIGLRKDSEVNDDWLCFDNFNLVYYGSDVDLDEIKTNLQQAINEAEAYEGSQLTALAAAITVGKAALEATEPEPIVTATANVQSALSATKAMNNALASAEAIMAEAESQWVPPFFTGAVEAAKAVLNTEDFTVLQGAAEDLQYTLNNTTTAIETYGYLIATAALAEKEGVASNIIAEAKERAEYALNLFEVLAALNELRTARKVNAAETHPDIFKGSEPSEGDPIMRNNDFYIYNIGTKRFLCGGDDWGAHCAVGFPGQAVTLLVNENAEQAGSYIIDTHLSNGGYLEYLGYNGYMDTGTHDPWFFRPVEGKPGVYNICRQGDNEMEELLLGYDPSTYNTVYTTCMGRENPNNQWKLVSRYEREDLLLSENVNENNPVDASFYISCPNFSQRDDASAWYCEADGGSASIYGRGGNNPDFAYEGWNTNSFQLSQFVEDLPAGWYRVSCTGFYRDGDHTNQILNYAEGKADDPNYQPKRLAEFYAGDSEDAWTVLPNITEAIDKMPGMGNRSSARRDYGIEVDPEERYGEWQYIGEFPFWASEACNWFQMGYYKAEVLVEVKNDGEELMICINKANPETAIADWLLVDNFRLTYFGTDKPTNWRTTEANNEPAVLLGDANCDGSVDVVDVTTTVDFILQKSNPSTRQRMNTDVNKDQSIDVVDLTSIVSIILGTYQPANGTTRVPALRLQNEDALLLSGTEIALRNSREFVAFQMDVTLADGAELRGVQLSQRAAGHNVSFHKTGKNTYRILAYSLSNTAITDDEGYLLKFNISGDQQIAVTDALFTDGRAAYNLNIGNATGIQDLDSDGKRVNTFDLNGRRVNTITQKGVYIVNGKKTIK